MMKQTKRILFVFLLLFGVWGKNTLRAQSDSLIFSPYGLIGLNDTVLAYDSIPAGAFIKNLSSGSPFLDSLQIFGLIDTGVVVPFYIPPFDSIYIQPNDSVFFIIPFVFRPGSSGGPFKIGGNTIVIWPASVGNVGGGTDSLEFVVTVLDTISGIIDPPSLGSVRLFPIPSSGPLYVITGTPHFGASSATVYDNFGKRMFETKEMANGIDMSDWPKGIYYIDVIFDNGWRKTYKIVRN
jgi:hypothetical protein